MGNRSRLVRKVIVAAGTAALVAVMASFAFAASHSSGSANGYGYTPPCGYSCSSTTGSTGNAGGSSAKPGCKVPNLVNKKKAVIRPKLAAAHCALGKLIKHHNSAKRGLVIKVNPPAGTKHRAGRKVDVTVSLGPKPKSKR